MTRTVRPLATVAPLVAPLVASLALIWGATAQAQSLPVGYGESPTLPAPKAQLIPTTKTYTSQPWKAGATPVAAAGLKVTPFAQGLVNPRWVYTLPNGDVLVAECNTPAKASGSTNVFTAFANLFTSLFSGANKSANRITLLRDADGDGVAEVRTPLLTGLNSPIGMVLVGNTLYIANTDAVVKVPYTTDGTIAITAKPEKLTDLPSGAGARHWTRNLIANADGSKLYVAVGSASNIAESGLAADEGRGAIWEVDTATGAKRLFAQGLRNPVGLAWNPITQELWTAVNERDQLGNDLVPDYMTSVRQGDHFGWPWSYFGANVDTRVKPANPEVVAQARTPDFALGAHTASLGLAWSAPGNGLPAAFQRGMVVGMHGSWNRNPVSGYKVVFVPFDAAGKPLPQVVDVLSGFINSNRTNGRPVGVAFDPRGGLLVADDTGNTVWRVSSAP
ncbi:MAG: hypothetical protein RI907_1620 [Pseudomonadota bacterium]